MADTFHDRLESVSWQRPGVLEVVVSRQFIVGNDEPLLVKCGNVYKTKADLRFVSNEVRYEDRVSSQGLGLNGRSARLYSKWQAALGLSSPTAEDSEREREVWTVNFLVNERDIVLHPDFDKIQAAGWGQLYDGRVMWPRLIYVKNTEGEEGEDEEVPVKNPMYGVTSYLAPRVEVVLEELDDAWGKVSAEVLDEIGWYNVPDNAPPFVSGLFVLTGAADRKGRDGVRRRVWSNDSAFKSQIYDPNSI